MVSPENASLAGESVNLIGMTSTLLVVGASAGPSKSAGGMARMVILLASSEKPFAAIDPVAITDIPARSESGMTATSSGVAVPSAP